MGLAEEGELVAVLRVGLHPTEDSLRAEVPVVDPEGKRAAEVDHEGLFGRGRQRMVRTRAQVQPLTAELVQAEDLVQSAEVGPAREEVVHGAAAWDQQECDCSWAAALVLVHGAEGGLAPEGEDGLAPAEEGGLAPAEEGGVAHGEEGGSAPVGQGGVAHGGEGGLVLAGEGGVAHGVEGGSVLVGEGGLVLVGEGGSALVGEGGSTPVGEGGVALVEEEDNLSLQIVGLVRHCCSLVEEAVGSSGCVWDQTVPFLPLAMVCPGQRRSKEEQALLLSSQEEAWEVLPQVCSAFFLDRVVHKAAEGPLVLGPFPTPWGHLVGCTPHGAVVAVVAACVQASNEVGAVCLQGDAEEEVLLEESLVLEGLSAEVAFHQKTHPQLGNDPLALASKEKHQQ